MMAALSVRAGCLLLMLVMPWTAVAQPAEDVWRDVMELAAHGHDAQAVAALRAAARLAPGDVWRARMASAAALLAMRERARRGDPVRQVEGLRGVHAALARQWMAAHPVPEGAPAWPAGLLAALLPGAGHAWLGRWRDAGVAAALVWPMLVLTLWAARRRMGPVTVFFAAITLWLWSGTVFSAVSLAERGSLEDWLGWWQQLWQAAGLPGRPW
ncbi:MAG: hypothetical protein R8K47_00275 [Mariprofundaceae bacterium]